VGVPSNLFQHSANPEEAENFFANFRKAFRQNHQKEFVPDETNLSFLKIFGNSKFLCRFAINNTWVYEQYLGSKFKGTEKPLEQFTSEIKTIVTNEAQPDSTLKKYKYQEFLRLTLKELSGMDQATTYRELSHLAAALVAHSVKKHHAELSHKHGISAGSTGEYAIIALGKLGGQELNYSSDIDIIGLYDEDPTLSDLSRHQFYSQLFAQTGQHLSHVDKDGFFFRVDWDLRPEGKTGVLANSLGAMERYYQTFGQEWERQAFIKAHVLLQTRNLGDRFLVMLAPFVFRRSFDSKTIHNIWNMKTLIEQDRKNNNPEGINIKLDEGGIRDIEFFVQGFQLLHGGKSTELRTTNTAEALLRLSQHQLITTQIKNVLTQNYFFLRRLESCLQMDNEQQTHVLKNDPRHKLAVARRLGFTHPEKEALSILEERLFNVMSATKRIFHEHYDR